MVQDVQRDPLVSSEDPGTVSRGLLGISLRSLRGCGVVTTENRGEGARERWLEGRADGTGCGQVVEFLGKK